MSAGWGAYEDWSLRIVRKQGEEPIAWHVIIDEPDHELEVTQCGDGSGAWVDLAAINVYGGDLSALVHLCRDCAKGLGWFARRCEEEDLGHGR